jgi:hypothetical protein
MAASQVPDTDGRVWSGQQPQLVTLLSIVAVDIVLFSAHVPSLVISFARTIDQGLPTLEGLWSADYPVSSALLSAEALLDGQRGSGPCGLPGPADSPAL